jgi:hypothetical protein
MVRFVLGDPGMRHRRPPLPGSRSFLGTEDETQTVIFDENAVTRIHPNRNRPPSSPPSSWPPPPDDDEITYPIPLVRRIRRK